MIDLDALRSRALGELSAVADSATLDAWRLNYLGRQGAVTQVLRGLGELAPDERPKVGAAANALRGELETALKERESRMADAALESLEAESFDVSLPGRRGLVGRLHPITKTMRDMVAAFADMGFQVTEGPEVEYEYYNFEALRMAKHHPARDMQDTFWLDRKNAEDEHFMLLRTQTSPNQVRFMEKNQPPVRVVVPGRVYRYEATDATHEWMFHQVEILAVDEGLSMRQMKGTLTQFAQSLFGRDRPVRFRCHYFPFVEPGAEVDIQCGLCKGAGCRSCGGEGWLEIMGAGMVHREILENVGIDADRYTGFAAGIGVERIAMLRYGIDDMRYFFSNDLRFLRQF
ncbi:MAG: phenylalanine--tRNA ligase subunit alpha [Dehalococcoidia bacterium]